MIGKNVKKNTNTRWGIKWKGVWIAQWPNFPEQTSFYFVFSFTLKDKVAPQKHIHKHKHTHTHTHTHTAVPGSLLFSSTCRSALASLNGCGILVFSGHLSCSLLCNSFLWAVNFKFYNGSLVKDKGNRQSFLLLLKKYMSGFCTYIQIRSKYVGKVNVPDCTFTLCCTC